jgi:hypothetical protein
MLKPAFNEAPQGAKFNVLHLSYAAQVIYEGFTPKEDGMVLRAVALVLCLLSLMIPAAVSPVSAGGPSVCVPPSCAPAPISCAPQSCAPPTCGPSSPGLLAGGCFSICANICGAVISCPAFVMNCLLAPSPAPIGLPWGSSPRSCGPPPCAPVQCAPPVCAPPACVPAPITKCKPASFQPQYCAPVYRPAACPAPVPQCGPSYGSAGSSSLSDIFSPVLGGSGVFGY